MKVLPFSQTLAHPNDPLPKHLWRVAQRAMDSIAPSAKPEARLIAFLAGLFHDIGKASYYFQVERLQQHKKNRLTPHAQSSAVLSWWYTGEMKLELWIRIAIFVAILRHHGDLKDDCWHRELRNVRYDAFKTGKPLPQQLVTLDLSGIHHWLENLPQTDIVGFHLPINLPALTIDNIKAHF